MNRENILKVADVIEDHANKFDMDVWGAGDLLHNCGSAGCIGGWTLALFENDASGHSARASEYLGLTTEQGDELFFPSNYRDAGEVWTAVKDDPHIATAEQAATLLRMIADGTATFACDA